MDDVTVGRNDDAVMQMAYLVPDLQAGMQWWTAHFGVGPWFVIDRIGGAGVTYRGEPADAEFTLALAYSGDLNIEIVQTLDDRPSIYREARERRGYGFHHAARMVPNLQEAVADRTARGLEVLHRAPTPGGGRVCILDGGHDAPGMLELIEDTPATRAIFAAVRRASVEWDGRDPRRDFADVIAAAGL